MKIESTINHPLLPVNSKAMLNRLIELLDEHETNCLMVQSCKNDPRVKAVMWLLMSQVFDQFAVIDMDRLWRDLQGEVTE